MPDTTDTEAHGDRGGRRPLRGAVRVGLAYLALSVLWIVLTDWAVVNWVSDPVLQARLQTWKGIFFVALSAGLIFFLVRRELLRLREFEERHRTIAEQSLSGLYVIRGDQFVYVNPRLAQIFGYEVEELVGGPVTRVVAPEDRDMVRERIHERMIGEEEEARYKLTGQRKDGEHVRVEVHGRVTEWEGSRAIMGVLLDITEEERREESTRRSQRLQALGELTGAVAHDFNNLLTAIIAPMELSRELLEADHPALEEIDEAHESAMRAIGLTRQLLTFSRQRVYSPMPVDLAEVVRRNEPILRRVVDSATTLELDLASGLPAVKIDPGHFGQVILNLVLNSAQAVSGGGFIRVSTYAETDQEGGAAVVLEVEDTGPGIDPGTMDRVFDPFFTTKEEGTGLGLATVHGIVTQAGGSIFVDSEVGGGTAFRISLPAVEVDPLSLDEAGRSRHSKAAVPEGEGRWRAGGGTILVVDDEDPVRKVTRRVLERHGYKVITTKTGEAALNVVRSRPTGLDLVLLDVGLPDRSGLTVADGMREIRGDLSIVFTSGHTGGEVMERIGTAEPSFLDRSRPTRWPDRMRPPPGGWTLRWPDGPIRPRRGPEPPRAHHREILLAMHPARSARGWSGTLPPSCASPRESGDGVFPRTRWSRSNPAARRDGRCPPPRPGALSGGARRRPGCRRRDPPPRDWPSG